MTKEEKKVLREKFLALRQQLKKGQIQRNSAKIAQNLFSLKEFKSAQTIVSFVDYNNEPPTRAIIEKTLKLGKKIVIPKMNLLEKTLSFHAIKNWKELKPNAKGILEPFALKAEIPLHKIDLVLVPGTAFDENGHRLGSGQGYFDRALPKMKNAFKIGLVFEEFVVAELPIEDHDIAVDALVTEKKIRFFASGH